MVVVEEATQSNCWPCNELNPPLQALLNDNSNKAVFVGYHVWWPGPDAMYDDNRTDVDWRVGDYYTSIQSAPTIIVQGVSEEQETEYLTQTIIDDIHSETAEFDMNLEAEIIDEVLYISGDITSTATVSGDLRLRLIITEQVIYEEDLPFQGSNLETEFHHVFKKFVSGIEGITLDPTMEIGDIYNIEETYDLSLLNIYDYDQIEVVGLIQNSNTKFIHQAAKADDISVILNRVNNAAVNSIEGLPPRFCTDDQVANIEFELQNNGSGMLNSATINYRMNDEVAQTYEWTGTLATYEKEIVSLPTLNFVAQPENIATINLSNPNGATDENELDDTLSSAAIPLSNTGVNTVRIEILTDDFADENYWEIRNSNEEIVASGGNPNVGLDNIGTGMLPPPPHPEMYENNTLYQVEVPIEEADCYTFHITDYYGNGMIFSADSAYWKVLDQNGIELLAGIHEAFVETVDTYLGEIETVDTEEVIAISSVDVFPNPGFDEVVVAFDLVEHSEVSIGVFDAVGKEVFFEEFGDISAGVFREVLDIRELVGGVYFVRVFVGDGEFSCNLIVRN